MCCSVYLADRPMDDEVAERPDQGQAPQAPSAGDDLDRRSYDMAMDNPLSAKEAGDAWKTMSPAGDEELRKFSWAWLLPFRPASRSSSRFQGKGERPCPLLGAGWLSIMTWHWVHSTVIAGFRRPLQLGDLWRTHPADRAEEAGELVLGKWREEVARKGGDVYRASPGKAFVKAYWKRLLAAFSFMVLYQVFTFVNNAVFIYQILNYAQKDKAETTLGEGLLLVFGYFLSEVVRTLIFATHFHFSITTGLRTRAALNYIVFDKVMRLRNLGTMTVGQLVNQCVADGHRVFECARNAAMMIGAPIMTVLVISYTASLVGWPALVGSATVLLFFPIQVLFGRLTSMYRRKGVKITDQRVRLMNEILLYVKLIKMYAWELPFAKDVAEIRRKERKMLEGTQIVLAMSYALSPVIPAVASALTFATKTLTGGNLTVAEAFAVISCFNSMRFALGTLPTGVTAFTEARVAMPRLHRLLVQPDISTVPDSVEDEDNAIEFRHTSFAWDEEPESEETLTANGAAKDATSARRSQKEEKKFRKRLDSKKKLLDKESEGDDKAATDSLVNIDLCVKRGQIVGICGAFGSGKTSLLTSLLGGLRLKDGSVAVKGSIALVSQQAWILNASVRENILFGAEMNKERYERVLTASCLRPDLRILQDGDETEIGERGINLSGGQKQRVALARALYADRDIYLLDDPLSALDVHVGAKVFNELIKKELKGKTVLLVTHQLQFLQGCDHVVLMEGGQIAEQGTYAELMSRKTSFSELIEHYMDKDSMPEEQSTAAPALMSQRSVELRRGTLIASRSFRSQHSQMSSKSEKETAQAPAKLVKDEDRSFGVVTLATYKAFMKAAGGYLVSIFVLVFTAVAIAMKGVTDWWLSSWLRDGNGNATTVNATASSEENLADNPRLHFYVGVYFALTASFTVLILIRGFLYVKVMLMASSNLHNRIFKRVFSARMSFFESTPTGRILNRFSKDLDEIDSQLPILSNGAMQNTFIILLSVFFVAYVFPYLLIAIFVQLLMFGTINRVFNRTVREVKRLENISRSPLISHLGSSVQGLTTVHAFKKQDEFRSQFFSLLNQNTVCLQAFQSTSRWLGVRLDYIVVSLLTLTALMVVLTREDTPAALGALALTYIAQVSSSLQFTVRLYAESEARFTSVERLNYYAEKLEPEESPDAETVGVPEDWPSEGRIEFKDVSLRYREDTPRVLHKLKFEIGKCEKIGVVGRTGAGKSSLAVCLFRLVEIEEGQILVDGVDISDVQLSTLRSRLAIIPQDPVLFVGTIRYNLDPFNNFSDSEVWDVLEKTHLKQMVTELQGGLQTKVIENGENFSVGERQLLCMARALLRHSKILILDEATASIDSETDKLVQKTIRSCFSDCTLLTIAHRINTVMDSDRILVLQDGYVAEFDTPTSLLSRPKSLFAQLVAAAGKEMSS